jgi:hypothetical protein
MKFEIEIHDDDMDSMGTRFIRITPRLLRDIKIPYRAPIDYIGGSSPRYALIKHIPSDLSNWCNIGYTMKGKITLAPNHATCKLITYDRQKVLSEEWIPVTSETEEYYDVRQDNSIYLPYIGYKETRRPFVILDEKKIKENYSFAPTHELAEEIVQIREGKWLPKKGDKALRINRNTFKEDYSLMECSYELANDNLLSWVYFPSEKQCVAFVTKNKPNLSDCLQPGIDAANAKIDAMADALTGKIKALPKQVWEFSIGDIVMLKPDAPNTPRPRMVIHSFNFDPICVWFDKDFRFYKEKFSSSELIKIN